MTQNAIRDLYDYVYEERNWGDPDALLDFLRNLLGHHHPACEAVNDLISELSREDGND